MRADADKWPTILWTEHRPLKKQISRLFVVSGLCSLLAVSGIFLVAVAANKTPGQKPKSAVKFTKPQPFIPLQSRCAGKTVSVFKPEDAGDSVRSDPEFILNAKNPMFQSVTAQLCVESMAISGKQEPETTRISINKGGVTQCVVIPKEPKTSMPLRVAIETATLTDGRVLITRNTGWESITLSYLFILPEERHPLQDLGYWNGLAGRLMTEAAGFSRPGNEGKGQESLAHEHATEAAAGYAKRAKNPKAIKALSDPISLNESDIQLQTWINEIGQLPGGKGRYMEMVISLGPL